MRGTAKWLHLNLLKDGRMEGASFNHRNILTQNATQASHHLQAEFGTWCFRMAFLGRTGEARLQENQDKFSGVLHHSVGKIDTSTTITTIWILCKRIRMSQAK